MQLLQHGIAQAFLLTIAGGSCSAACDLVTATIGLTIPAQPTIEPIPVGWTVVDREKNVSFH